MQAGLLLLVGAIIMLSFLMLTQTRIINLVKLLVAQNIILTSYLLDKSIIYPSMELYISLSITFIIKVIILPYLLWKLTNYLHLSYRIEPLLKKSTLLLSAILLVIFAIMLCHQLEPIIGQAPIIGFSLALANSLLAVLLIIFRRKSISQVIGLLVLENSIFLLSTTLTRGLPWLVELGMSFDVLLGFMIFGLFLLRIQSSYGSLNIFYLEKMRERK